MKKFKLIVVGALVLSGAAHSAEGLKIDVHRDANCGCCKDWIKYLQDNGFTVIDHVETNMSAVKRDLGVPQELKSCHTGVIDGKIVEGHVPAAQIRELKNHEDLVGVSVPGMPAGSPGMDYGQAPQPYHVVGLTKAGVQETVADYPAAH